jgi:recombination protein RecT
MEDVRLHASKYSKAYDSSFSPWKSNFEEMAKKTVLKKVLKYAPLKSDFVRGISQDGTVKNEISDDMYSVPNEVVIDAEYSDISVDPGTGEVLEGGETV